MNRAQKSLLLFLETQAVDWSGKVATEHMNHDDFDIAETWNESGYIRFGRVPSKLMGRSSKGARTHWVILSDDALHDAGMLRAERAERGTKRLRQFLAPYKDVAVAAPAFE